MEQVTLYPIPLDQITGIFQNIIREELKTHQRLEIQEKLLSPKETCNLFNPRISLVTLASWTNKGLLTKHYIGGRTYYRYSEIMASIKSFKKYTLNKNQRL